MIAIGAMVRVINDVRLIMHLLVDIVSTAFELDVSIRCEYCYPHLLMTHLVLAADACLLL